MGEYEPFTKLLTAARVLIASRQRKGGVDARALKDFAAVVSDIDPSAHAKHRFIIDPGGETFAPRRGCLDCNVWLDPIRVKRA